MLGYVFPVFYASREKALMHLIMSSALWCTASILVQFRSNFLPILSLPWLAIIACIAAVPSDLARTRCADCVPGSWLEFIAPSIVFTYLLVSQLAPRTSQTHLLRRYLGLVLLSGQQVLLFNNPKLCVLCFLMGAGLLADTINSTSVTQLLSNSIFNLAAVLMA